MAFYISISVSCDDVEYNRTKYSIQDLWSVCRSSKSFISWGWQGHVDSGML